VTRHALALLASLLLCSPSYANFSMSPSGSTTLFAIDAANQGTSLCAASVTECAASVPINTAGAPLFTSTTPGLVTLTGTNNINNIAGTISLPTGAATSALQTTINSTLGAPMQNSGGSVTANAGTNLNTSALATSANQPTNATQGSTTSGQTGNLVQCAVTTAAPSYTTAQTDPLSCDTAGNVRVNVTNSNANGQAAMAASSPVALASNQSVGDPCTFQTKTNVPISTASGTTALVTGVSAKKVYVCALALIAPSAVSVSLAEGSSATCGTSNQAAVIGVATNGTAANGMPLAANGGLTLGSGTGTVAQTATAANYLCLFQSGTAQLAGNLTFVQQ
jgi:hypothetical protein